MQERVSSINITGTNLTKLKLSPLLINEANFDIFFNTYPGKVEFCSRER